MLMTLTLLALVSRIPYGDSLFHACIPNSQFHVNGRLCLCDPMGRWTEASCEITQRQICKPGQVIWEDCSQCICQENGHMVCSNTMCSDDATSKTIQMNKVIDLNRSWCVPFVSYYLNCSLCVCPATGKMNEARCASDSTCPFRGSTNYITAVKKNVCIPKVMYLFPCLHCLCSDDGYFSLNKCAETCHKPKLPDHVRRCIPRTFFKKSCNVCFCPDNGLANEKLCTKAECSHKIRSHSLSSLTNQTWQCDQHTFTKPTCFYCECTSGGINENSCVEYDCMLTDTIKYNYEKATCIPGEIVAKCMECFCLRDGFTDPKYCSKTCSTQQRVSILETAIKESFKNVHLIDRKSIKTTASDEVCEPNSIYKEQRRFCLCPANGKINDKLCTSVIEERRTEKTKISIRGRAVSIDFNVKCDPNTFVEFDCNTCYCFKSGRINPKWCTYDDCEAKRIILDKQKNANDVVAVSKNGACVPGAVSKEECNFCICPENGLLKDRACTKNSCENVRSKISNGLACEPLSYYNVDCNICYCPKSGVKNVAKCTKITCEKNFLRSEVCVPGRLFSDECNVCVCPPNGDKSDRVCTNNTCAGSDSPWKKIFQLSQSLLSYQTFDDTSSRSLELCFPGDKFEMGCKVCICPDMGLRVYATCTQILCDNNLELSSDAELDKKQNLTRRDDDEDCLKFDMPEKECTPGSMYIIRCQECICPYFGSIHYFCRPLPENKHCEQASVGVDYLPMGRRHEENGTTAIPPSSANASISKALKEDNIVDSPGPQTKWTCDKAARVKDDCFVCDCQDGIIIEELCFRSKHGNCTKAKPTFLKEIKLPNR